VTTTNALDAAIVFGFLSFLHFWGGSAIGAGARGRRFLPVVWGLLVGAAPLYFGVERGRTLGVWGALAWQLAVLGLSAVLVAAALPRVRALFLRPGMDSLMVGTFIMAAAAVIGAWFFRAGSELGSLLAGGAGFLFGAMWFGAGLKRLRGR
jgi:hypothetical protein